MDADRKLRRTGWRSVAAVRLKSLYGNRASVADGTFRGTDVGYVGTVVVEMISSISVASILISICTVDGTSTSK